MEIKLTTKYKIGDIVEYRDFSHKAVARIVGIRICVESKKTRIRYDFDGYSGAEESDIIRLIELKE
jgi:hypothetical protein